MQPYQGTELDVQRIGQNKHKTGRKKKMTVALSRA